MSHSWSHRGRIASSIWADLICDRHRRNAALHWAACRFAELVGEGAISRDGAAELLTPAATLNGYLAEDGQEAVEATIGSGLGGGEREDEIS